MPGMNDERAAEGLDHLQAAALEMIKAARAFLDVAEDLVADRDRVAEVVSALGTVADVTTRAVRDRGVHGGVGTAADDEAAGPSDAAATDGEASDGARGAAAGAAGGSTSGTRAGSTARPARRGGGGVEHIRVSS